ncbi:hypothetical protein VNO78_34727 [Psophocarpus tetragonolobus]|uniref:Secreted protein n=1 Tax=Psophocarpus tetragonolobus TaxID=3891 RepID=A0AAN9RLP0_PSOTE
MYGVRIAPWVLLSSVLFVCLGVTATTPNTQHPTPNDNIERCRLHLYVAYNRTPSCDFALKTYHLNSLPRSTSKHRALLSC